MAICVEATLSGLPDKKRVRERKYASFGDLLKDWRGDRDIEEVARQVRHTGLQFDGATLRGWEYGWSASPDPLRLLALTRVYDKPFDVALAALAAARKVNASDLISHLHRKSSGHSHGGSPDAAAAARIRELETALKRNEVQVAVYKSIIRKVRPLLSRAITVVGRKDADVAPSRTKRGGHP